VRTAPPAPARPTTALELDIQRNERLLEIREARFGVDHPDVASICQILGQLYVANAEYEKAEAILARALHIVEEYDREPLTVASIVEDLAVLDERLARRATAEAHWRRALDLRSGRLPPGHPDRMWAALRLGLLLCRQEKYPAAESVLKPVTEISPPHSRESVLALSTLAIALAGQADRDRSEQALAQARATMDAIFASGRDTNLSTELDVVPTVTISAPALMTSAPTAGLSEPTVAGGRTFDIVSVVRPLRHARPKLGAFATAARDRSTALSRDLVALLRVAIRRGRPAVTAGRALRLRLAARSTLRERRTFAMGSMYSAQRRLNDGQRRTFFALAGVIALMGAFAPIVIAQLLIAFVTALYLASLTFRVHAFWHGLRSPGSIQVSDEMARSVADEDLPVYTILVPAYHEPEVIGRLIASLVAIEYPADRLDVKLLLEDDDAATFEAARAAKAPAHIQIVRVPVSQPRTKPKALNYGLRAALGQLITIYDAEDRPEPLQLRRAVVAFGSLSRRVVCLQAKLSYHNAGQNLLTRWFTAEYATWFSHLLPGLAERRMPLPLGGTSNHFRRAALEGVGAWDPYNVTEDADLGIRLYRAGFIVDVLESTTLEEANSDFINWMKQRSRWYKGYLQTWLVHMRDPVRLWHELGPKGFVAFNLFVGGTPLLTLVSPIFWTLTLLWFVAHWTAIPLLFPGWLYYVSLFCLVVGNFSFLYMGVISSRATGRPELVPAMLIAPMYWAMMSIAAIKAFVQLLAAPSFWEKTTHGLDELVRFGEKRGAA